MSTTAILAILLAACGTKNTDDTGGSGDGGSGDGGGTGVVFEDYINVTVQPTGDIDSCFDGVNWFQQEVDPNLQDDIAMEGLVADFETGDAVADATLDLWFGNDPTVGAPDYSVVSGADGYAASTFKVCTPIAYRTTTDPALEATVDTYELNQVEPYAKGTIYPEFNSVSSTTYAIIPSLLGVSPDGDKGVIAGTAYDCGGDPIEGAQVVVRDHDTGAIPDSLVVKYFVDSFPNRNQPYTSPDGLWVAVNVPQGSWDVEMYVYDGAGGYTLLGKSTAMIFPGSIMIANAYTGFEDGIRYPDNCTL